MSRRRKTLAPWRERLSLALKPASGIKRWYVPGPHDGSILTPYAFKERARRRAAGKRARLAKRRNR